MNVVECADKMRFKGFGAGSVSTTHRDVNEVKFEDIKEGGQIIIPPSPPGMTYLLGALGKVQ